jgi:hypothetical protein
MRTKKSKEEHMKLIQLPQFACSSRNNHDHETCVRFSQELTGNCWGSALQLFPHLFPTMVPHSGYFAQSAGRVFAQDEGPCLALGDTEIKRVFAALLKEIKTRIDHESKRLATVSA